VSRGAAAHCEGREPRRRLKVREAPVSLEPRGRGARRRAPPASFPERVGKCVLEKVMRDSPSVLKASTLCFHKMGIWQVLCKNSDGWRRVEVGFVVPGNAVILSRQL
jgi:hypothetical protein